MTRRYTNGSWLASHLDRFSTHVISAILNIGQVCQAWQLQSRYQSSQAVEEDWPLYILDNSGAPHSVLLQPGDMLWYESARAVHGRPRHFKGEYFDNLFIHYRSVLIKIVPNTFLTTNTLQPYWCLVQRAVSGRFYTIQCGRLTI